MGGGEGGEKAEAWGKNERNVSLGAEFSIAYFKAGQHLQTEITTKKQSKQPGRKVYSHLQSHHISSHPTLQGKTQIYWSWVPAGCYQSRSDTPSCVMGQTGK